MKRLVDINNKSTGLHMEIFKKESRLRMERVFGSILRWVDILEGKHEHSTILAQAALPQAILALNICWESAPSLDSGRPPSSAAQVGAKLKRARHDDDDDSDGGLTSERPLTTRRTTRPSSSPSLLARRQRRAAAWPLRQRPGAVPTTQ